jgi:hypothetical protein
MRQTGINIKILHIRTSQRQCKRTRSKRTQASPFKSKTAIATTLLDT